MYHLKIILAKLMSLCSVSRLGELMKIEIPVLQDDVIDLLEQVPHGKVTTFKALAIALGDAIASRAVGQIVAEIDLEGHPLTHRVVYSDGEVGGSKRETEGVLSKIERLNSEGIPIRDSRIENLHLHLVQKFDCDQPLKILQQVQNKLADEVYLHSLKSDFATAAGVDLSYKNPRLGIGAYVAVDVATRNIMKTHTVERATHFPYIPSYLAFRELPTLIQLIQEMRENGDLADVILVDGTGILHPRHTGIASQLGVLCNISTIGITKKKLYGSVAVQGMSEGEIRPIIDPHGGHQIGVAIKTTQRADPIYVSVGHGIDLETSIELVLKLAKQKLPEPVHRAHLLSKEVAQQNNPKVNLQRALDL